MTPLVRPARPSDGDALVGLDARLTHSRWPEQRLRAACVGAPEPAPAALLAASGEPGEPFIAYLVYQRLLDEVTVQHIAVDPAWRGQGVGRALLGQGLQLWAQAGARRSLLEVRRSNAAAIGLYRRCGFEQDGMRRDYYPAIDDSGTAGREDALLMSRPLHPSASRPGSASGGCR